MTSFLIAEFLVYCLLTLLIYQCFAKFQQKTQLIWLNPMVMSMLVIIPLLLYADIGYAQYYQHTQFYSFLLEPAVVALGFPLYQQLQVIKKQFKQVVLVLSGAIGLMFCANFSMAYWLFNKTDVAVSLSLKSVTTPIGLALTDELHGVAAITAVGIIVAGVVGAALGPKLLSLCGVDCKKSQGLAIGCASHALGTASITSISYDHGAFASLALILSAFLTAVFSPLLTPVLLQILM
ncbi:LrgB family protein [Thalassotalea euphylliae]|uniref:LrgB family protein n=1 Tax=Thalassotalea euphylliae TaxID=1655234 RepID=A0A3E0TQT9_9GAMM|nr:LrgB family protein [Thalassotalea euphylliae]REL26700.1 LrgB family protein [Thalassotalea euphylliae]